MRKLQKKIRRECRWVWWARRAVSKHLYLLMKTAAQNGPDDFTVIRQIESTNIVITFEFSKSTFYIADFFSSR